MSEYLVLQLVGPMASWGEIAVGEIRGSWAMPSKSAVLGLVAGSLGIRRDQDEEHLALDRTLGFAAICDEPGVPLSDYHTAQAAYANEKPKGGEFISRAHELSREAKSIRTILSTREYYVGARWRVCLWQKEAAGSHTLGKIAHALANPVFVPFLGRKACPPALPFDPQLISATDPQSAFAQYAPLLSAEMLGARSARVSSGRMVLETEESAPSNGARRQERRDAIISRSKWRFGPRLEDESLTGGKDL